MQRHSFSYIWVAVNLREVNYVSVGERKMQAGMDNLTRKAAKCQKEESDYNLDHKKISEEMARW